LKRSGSAPGSTEPFVIVLVSHPAPAFMESGHAEPCYYASRHRPDCRPSGLRWNCRRCRRHRENHIFCCARSLYRLASVRWISWQLQPSPLRGLSFWSKRSRPIGRTILAIQPDEYDEELGAATQLMGGPTRGESKWLPVQSRASPRWNSNGQIPPLPLRTSHGWSLNVIRMPHAARRVPISLLASASARTCPRQNLPAARRNFGSGRKSIS
jgi:hypothetical protein